METIVKPSILDANLTYGNSVYESRGLVIKTFREVVEDIKSSSYLKEIVSQIRSTNRKEEARKIKANKLPYINFGAFNEKRRNEHFLHTEYVIVDFDNINDDEFNVLYNYLKQWTYTSALFISPSGNGIKLIIKIAPKIESQNTFAFIYQHLLDIITKEFNVHPDRSTCDPARPCFLSYDPNIYVNEDALPFDYSKIDLNLEKEDKQVRKREEILFLMKTGVEEGERHNAMLRYMSMLLRRGTDVDFLYQIMSGWNLKNQPPYSDSEFDSEFTSILKSIQNREEFVFWIETDKKQIQIIHEKFIEFLTLHGFYKIKDAIGKYYFAKVSGNILSLVTPIEIKEYVNTYLKKSTNPTAASVISIIIRQNKNLFSEDTLHFLSTLEPNLKTDSTDKAYLYFENCFVEITQKTFRILSYSDFDTEYIWENNIINHRFSFNYGQSEFDRFITNLAGNDKDRYETLVTSLAYLIHDHKNPALAKAIVFCDEDIPLSDEANGGTGKSLVCHSLSYLRKSSYIDGKNYRTDDKFKFQNIDRDTKIIVFDDVRKNFDFESLLSATTSGLSVEKKNRDSFTIPFKESPKIIITTNYTIKGSGNSFERRKHEIEFHNHYNKYNTPDKEFGHRLFDDWDKDEWNKFYSTIIQYMQKYLSMGLVNYKSKNLSTRKILDSTNQEFLDYISNHIKLNLKYVKNDALSHFKELYPEYATIKSNTFTKWFNVYAENKNLKLRDWSSNKVRYFRLEENTEYKNSTDPAKLSADDETKYIKPGEDFPLDF